MKESIKEYFCVVIRKKKSPYELCSDIIGREGSGRGDLSVRGEEILRSNKHFRLLPPVF
jgi:hypothetical protein